MAATDSRGGYPGAPSQPTAPRCIIPRRACSLYQTTRDIGPRDRPRRDRGADLSSSRVGRLRKNELQKRAPAILEAPGR